MNKLAFCCYTTRMKGVTIEGVEYIAASALAKQFRYTSDYIGQLCRVKKVDAKLLGRTWYVNPLSLTKHKKAKYKKVLPAEKTTEIIKDITLSRIEIDPQIFFNKNKHQKPAAIQQPHFARRIDWKPLKYEADELALLPQMSRHKDVSQKIKLNLAEATSISVKNNTSKETKLVPDELPTVSLKGKLRIESLNETFTDDTETPIPEMILTESITAPENIVSSPNRRTPAPLGFHHGRQVSNSRVSLIPTNLSRTQTSIASVTAVDNRSGRTVEVLLLASTTILVGCLFLLLFGELNLFARPGFYEWEFALSTQSLPALVSLFSQ